MEGNLALMALLWQLATIIIHRTSALLAVNIQCTGHPGSMKGAEQNSINHAMQENCL